MGADYVVNGHSAVHLTSLPRSEVADDEVGARAIGYDAATRVA